MKSEKIGGSQSIKLRKCPELDYMFGATGKL